MMRTDTTPIIWALRGGSAVRCWQNDGSGSVRGEMGATRRACAAPVVCMADGGPLHLPLRPPCNHEAAFKALYSAIILPWF